MVVQKLSLDDEWQYILIAYAILTTVILVAVLIFIWPLPEMVEFAGALVGAAVGGVISLTIMYFTNEAGRKKAAGLGGHRPQTAGGAIGKNGRQKAKQ